MSNLKGSLESISLMDVVQLLNVNRKSGRLQLGSGRQSGVLHFHNGEVVNAELGGLKGEMAAFEILEWVSGTFDFVPSSAPMAMVIRRSVQDLLMDAARISDSRKRLRSIFPKLNAVPWPSLPGDQLIAGLKVFTEEKRILPFFDGFRDFQEIMDSTGQNDVAVLQAASILKEAGRLEVFEPEITLNVVTLKTGLFKKGDHLQLSKTLDAQWRQFGPYVGGILNLRVMWPQGPAVESVKFVSDLGDQHIAIPKEFMLAWGLAEGVQVKVRPAP
jgi:Domain of unknown function (DUF4388)